jgi:phospholipase C
VGDLRDPEYAERLEHEQPEAYYRRREFLQRTALTAGVAAGLGTLLDPETLVAEAARKQRSKKLPSPRNLPIDTFVVLMMENRSFDHYLGWLPGADGRQAGLTYTDLAGAAHTTHRLAPDFQGCDHPDPDHSWEGGRAQVNSGAMDGFLRSGLNDEFSIGYYAEEDLPFVGHVAKAFTSYDRFFCSLLASTYPNREYMHAAQSYGKVDNSFPEAGFQDQGFPDTTIFAALKARGVDSRYFFNDLPVSALWGQKGLARSSRVEDYYLRCEQGTLPPLSFVDPAFGNESGGTSSIRTATSERGRRSWRTWCTRSWSRRSGSAARSSSCTTSGAASSTTCARRACRTSGTAATGIRTSARWGCGSPRSLCRRG